MLTVGIDLGGTFVDGYFADDDRWMTCKVPTSRFDLTRSVVACIGAGADALREPLEGFLERIDLLRLSTTVGTNAIVEGKGSRVGLVVTSGQERTLYGAEPPTALFDTFIDPDFVRGATLPSDAEEELHIVPVIDCPRRSPRRYQLSAGRGFGGAGDAACGPGALPRALPAVRASSARLGDQRLHRG